MLKLDRPKIESKTAYKKSVDGIVDDMVKLSFMVVEASIETSSADYLAKGPRGELYLIPSATNVGAVSGQWLSSLYEDQMVSKTGAARNIYDFIRSRSKKCALCGHQAASTLDHFLPKSSFPAFAVNPANLVPCCRDCNTHKGRKVITTAGGQLFHPYFDDFSSSRWLYAKVVEEAPPSINFYVGPLVGLEPTFKMRAEKHLCKLRLKDLYSANAAEELVNIAHRLEKLGISHGSAGIRAHLVEEAESCAKARLNSWQSAMYKALSESDWFCGGGFCFINEKHAPMKVV